MMNRIIDIQIYMYESLNKGHAFPQKSFDSDDDVYYKLTGDRKR